jgi:hypothetical protein
MNAVAIMTPEPKYFAMKKTHDGMPSLGFLFATIGKRAPATVIKMSYKTRMQDEEESIPKDEVTSTTKIADIRTPKRPLYSLSVEHESAILRKENKGKLFQPCQCTNATG